MTSAPPLDPRGLRARRGARKPGRRFRDEGGSTLAALMATLAVMSIMMTVAMTQWSFIVRREKEKELIFRGTAIARGIQEFQQKQGRAPTTLEEMTKTRPPCLRHVYADPMTAQYDRQGELIEGTGEWTFIGIGQPGGTGLPGQQPGQPGQAAQPGQGQDGQSGMGGRNRTPGVTAFLGVRSKSEELTIGSFRDSEPGVPYSEWRFQVFTADTADRMQHVGGFDPIYPPGFGGFRVPGGPPFGGAAGPAGGGRRPGQQQGSGSPR